MFDWVKVAVKSPKSGGRAAKKSSVENRRAPRYVANSVGLSLDGRQLDIIDISVTGVLARGAPDWIADGQGITFNLTLPVRGQTAYVAATGRVTRTANGNLAIHYRSLYPNWRQMMAQFLDKEAKPV